MRCAVDISGDSIEGGVSKAQRIEMHTIHVLRPPTHRRHRSRIRHQATETAQFPKSNSVRTKVTRTDPQIFVIFVRTRRDLRAHSTIFVPTKARSSCAQARVPCAFLEMHSPTRTSNDPSLCHPNLDRLASLPQDSYNSGPCPRQIQPRIANPPPPYASSIWRPARPACIAEAACTTTPLPPHS